MLLFAEVRKVLIVCYEHGFLTADIQKKEWAGDSMQVVINLNQQYKWAQIKPGNVPAEWLTHSSYKQNQFAGKDVSFKLFSKRITEILTLAQNNGFPFASIRLDSIMIDSSCLTAILNIDKGQLIYFDSMDFGGTAIIKKRFLQNYSNIYPGSIYNESFLTNLDAGLSELPFLKVVRPLGVYFYGNKAKPVVYIDNRKASTFDGIIGFAPNSALNNKLVVTGEVNLKLQNILGSGKYLDISFRSFLNKSQDLLLKFNWPYFLNSKLGIDYSFKLLKFDSSYLDVFNDFGLQYRFMGNNFFKVFYQVQRVSLIYADTQMVKTTKALPIFNDIRNDLFGLGLRKARLNYFLNPSRGYLIELDGGVGTKRILRNSTIDAIELQSPNGGKYSIYDSIKLVSMQYRANIFFVKYFKLPSDFVLQTQFKGAVVYTQNLFLNELFRIGGLKSLKGFDEQSIFADKYGIANIELRYLFQQNSSFILFWNGAWYQNIVRSPNIIDTPWGIGAGMNVETGAGIFSLFYAVGKQMNNPVELRNAKIHFGFINYF